MDQYYSQFGEDACVQSYFKRKAYARTKDVNNVGIGYFVDVGACRPIASSNTFWFYLRGWRGINIDATPGAKEQRLGVLYFAAHGKNRYNSVLKYRIN